VTGFRYRGARVLVALHDEQMHRFLETWSSAKTEGVDLPRVDDPDYESLESLLGHVLRWSGTYLSWSCEKLGLPDPEIGPVPAADTIESDAEGYMADLLGRWETALCDVEADRFFKSDHLAPWGVPYSVEAMLEHAVVHPVRHRFQLEELMGLRRGGPTRDSTGG
jgi:uncharacterized damage-inducible protein DinB